MGQRKTRVRSKRLERIDESKMWLALYLMARGVVEDKTTSPRSNKPAKDRPREGRA
jgi:hypothetical protein